MSIHDTVDTSLNQAGLRQYRSSAQPVVDSLVQREQDLCQTAAEAAAEKWRVPVEEVLAFMEEQGYHVHATEPDLDTPADADGAEAPSWASDLIARVTRLEEVARSRGLLR